MSCEYRDFFEVACFLLRSLSDNNSLSEDKNHIISHFDKWLIASVQNFSKDDFLLLKRLRNEITCSAS